MLNPRHNVNRIRDSNARAKSQHTSNIHPPQWTQPRAWPVSSANAGKLPATNGLLVRPVEPLDSVAMPSSAPGFRVDGVEGLRSHVLSDISSRQGPTPSDECAAHSQQGRASSIMGEFVAPEFWNFLSEEIHGLREVLENPNDEQEDAHHASLEPEPGNQHADVESAAGAMIFQSGQLHGCGIKANYPSLDTQTKLLELYRYRVESLHKLFHWPTTLSIIEAALADSAGPPSPVSTQALEFAIYFMALCSVSDNEAEAMGLGNRQDLARLYQATTEALLARSHLLTKPDVPTLQAFVIYLTALRTQLSNGLAWTLIAVAVRAATALRLGEEDIETFTAFDIEIRRRLLFGIAALDSHAALDRGTVPLMPSTAFVNPPLNINDEDMSPKATPATSAVGFTDMSFSAMVNEAMVCQRKLYEMFCDAGVDWAKKAELVSAFEKSLKHKYIGDGDSSRPLENFQTSAARQLVGGMKLMLRRPPYRQPCSPVPAWDTFDTMEAATAVLEQHLVSRSPEFSAWAWKTWVQWPALATVLAELCGRPHGAASDHSYRIAARSFREFSRLIADSESGMLWKPIARLMRRVQHVRKGSSETTTSSPTHTADLERGSTEAAQSYQTDFNGQLSRQLEDQLSVSDLTTGIAPCSTENGILDAVMDNSAEFWSQSNDLQPDTNISWVNWDLFLQDVNLLHNLP
ncbi:hypothetical protein AK830_g5548 [Neonectria ditissima]|uniref:Xylanolytic transcriptional activator regulatory domain-containing protein n=1 Tax=Neonectria ditissima TaxID=78410 RepID=A0A0P7BKM2_9HYPO|nr:hypothetical protein AK830_g5548 [Neonectria ditissima]